MAGCLLAASIRCLLAAFWRLMGAPERCVEREYDEGNVGG